MMDEVKRIGCLNPYWMEHIRELCRDYEYPIGDIKALIIEQDGTVYVKV